MLALAASVGSVSVDAAAKKQRPPPPPSPWGDWVERDFPFFSSVLDARKASAGSPANNLTPRGLVLNLGRDCWVCFDTDLLRVAAVWRGKGVTPKGLAPGSYHDSGRKTPGGQFPAPQPDGTVWLANGIYPGWQAGERPSLEDPREPAPSPEEVGRGPLPETMGRFKTVRLVQGGAALEYTAAGAEIRDWFTCAERDGRPVIERHITVGASAQPLVLALGLKPDGPATAVRAGVTLTARKGARDAALMRNDTMWMVSVKPRKDPVALCVTLCEEGAAPSIEPRTIPVDPPAPRWPQEIASKIKPSTAPDAYVVDDVALPLDNPWRRDVRLGDIQFLKDGTGVGVTIDGDVWLVRGLHEPGGTVRWRRFASGLHEPMTCAIRDGEIYVFDRNGIWRLRDTDGNGEADAHELFSSVFAQTADMREFPCQVRLAPGGEFVIAKGGQQATTLGRHNGSVLRISADGRRATVLGYGFRQPNIGVDPRTGLVTASDQEGQYIPTTPLHIVRDGQFYGYLSDGLQPRGQYPAPIAEPLTWIPHAVNASAISQVWLFDAKMGPLNDGLVHIGFNKPEIFRVLMNHRSAKPQAAVVSVTGAFEFPPLNGSVNPADGRLYVAGFQVVGWGTTATRISGLARVRHTGAPCTLPREVVPMDQGVLLRFDVALDAKKARDPNSYSLASFHYVRSYKYGSALYKADGTTGQDWLTPSSAYLSEDGRSVFVGVPGMKPVMQLRVGWSLAAAGGALFEENAYTTPYELPKFDPRAEGFGGITVDLTPRAAVARAAGPVNAEEGRRVYRLMGCAACHSVDGTRFFHIGPTWLGLFGSEVSFFAGGRKRRGAVVADEAYLRESILDPPAKIVAGYERGEYAMPSYAGVITESQVESLVLFIKTLKDDGSLAKNRATSGPPPIKKVDYE